MDNVQFPISNLGEMVVVKGVKVDNSSEVNADELVGAGPIVDEVPFNMDTCWLVGTKKATKQNKMCTLCTWWKLDIHAIVMTL